MTGLISPSDVDKLPETPGLYRLHSTLGIVRTNVTSNLRRTVKRLCTSDNSATRDAGEPEIQGISYEPTESLLEAYLSVRFDTGGLPVEGFAEYSKNLAYLAVNPLEAPYLWIADTPMGHAFYLGPFSSRFLIQDVIDLFVEREIIPPAEDDTGKVTQRNVPAELLLRSVIGAEMPESLGASLLDGLQTEFEEAMDALEFDTAEKIRDRIRLLQDFYGEVKFLLTTKRLDLQLTFDDWSITAKSGLLTEVKHRGEALYTASEDHQEYLPGETLSVSLEQRLERWMIFQYAQHHLSLPLEETCAQARREFLTQLKMDKITVEG